MASRRKPAQEDPVEVRAPHLAEGERRARAAWRVAGVVAVALVTTGVLLAAGMGVTSERGAAAAAAVAGGAALCAGLAALVGALSAGDARNRARLAAARALLEAGCHDAAIVDLKALVKEPEVKDEASYLVALSYDRQGARRLALESYRAYAGAFKRGAWVVEARVRIEELEGQAAAAAAVDLQARVSDAQTCPFCKTTVGDDPTVACEACGTPHHAACWDEQRGCSVYGCASRAAKAGAKADARARE